MFPFLCHVTIFVCMLFSSTVDEWNSVKPVTCIASAVSLHVRILVPVNSKGKWSKTSQATLILKIYVGKILVLTQWYILKIGLTLIALTRTVYPL